MLKLENICNFCLENDTKVQCVEFWLNYYVFLSVWSPEYEKHYVFVSFE